MDPQYHVILRWIQRTQILMHTYVKLVKLLTIHLLIEILSRIAQFIREIGDNIFQFSCNKHLSIEVHM